MKNFKKVLACVMAVATLGCGASSVVVSAYNDDVENNNAIVSKDTFQTVYEKNGLSVVKADFNEDSTILYFDDDTTYTLPMCDDVVLGLKVPTEDDTECYYIIGYAINYKQPHKYEKDSKLDEYPTTATLPDGTDINISTYDNIQAVFDLDGKYMGYRTEFGENGYSEIMSSVTIGDSENKPITEITVGDSTFPRGDINLDGKVNTVDLLMLKKYLLGLMEW